MQMENVKRERERGNIVEERLLRDRSRNLGDSKQRLEVAPKSEFTSIDFTKATRKQIGKTEIEKGLVGRPSGSWHTSNMQEWEPKLDRVRVNNSDTKCEESTYNRHRANLFLKRSGSPKAREPGTNINTGFEPSDELFSVRNLKAPRELTYPNSRRCTGNDPKFKRYTKRLLELC